MTNLYARRRSARRPAGLSVYARAKLAGPVLGLLLAACDFPTALPKWDTQWIVPSKSTTITVGELLPASVTLSGDKSAFLVSVPAVSISRTLGQFCPDCALLNGLSAPKPAFTATVTDTMRLPADVTGATLASGSVTLALTNGFGFDPLRPNGTSAPRGSLTISVLSGSTTVGTMTLAGDSVALPPNSTLNRTLVLNGAAVGSKLTVSVTLNSPAGGVTTIDTNQRFTVTATPQPLRLSDATVNVAQKRVNLSQTELSLSDIDQSVVDRVKGGALVLIISNPFAVTGTLNVTFTGASMPITKQVTLAAGTTTQKVQFTQQELQAILGRDVFLNASGTVNAASPVKVTPAQAVQITTQFELTLGPKEG